MPDEIMPEETNVITTDTPVEYPYRVMHPNGEYIMHAPESCRYDPHIEQSMLTDHYRIFNGEHEITLEEVEALIAAEEAAEQATAEAIAQTTEKPKRTRRKKEATSV